VKIQTTGCLFFFHPVGSAYAKLLTDKQENSQKDEQTPGRNIAEVIIQHSALNFIRADFFYTIELFAYIRCSHRFSCNSAVGDAAFNRATSPAGQQLKQPLLYLPPPPQHPPPSSSTTRAPQRHLSTDTCDDDDIYSRIPASSSDGGDHYPPSLPLVDYYTGHSSGYDIVDNGSYNDGLEDSLPPRRPPKAPTSKLVSASPQLQRRLHDQVCCFVQFVSTIFRMVM